jgi:ABC-2 type transport system ATP-binding protein
MKEPIIRTQSLSRDFKTNHAVSSLNLVIQPGELFGLVGPDGAGKTTILRLLAGLLDISDGSAEIAGYDLAREAEKIKPKIGYMAQQFSLYSELTVRENLAFFSEIYDVPYKALKARQEQLLTFAGLTDFKDRRAGHLSGGMQKKLALACTLVHQPEILLLDEPTTGVDPISRREFWRILTDLHLNGTTILCSTPYMDEADRCSRVGLIYAGKMIQLDTPRNVREQITGEWIELQPENVQTARAFLLKQSGVLEVQTYGRLLQVLVDSARKRSSQIERACKRQGIALHSLRPAPTRMEQAFISLIRHQESEEG